MRLRRKYEILCLYLAWFGLTAIIYNGNGINYKHLIVHAKPQIWEMVRCSLSLIHRRGELREYPLTYAVRKLVWTFAHIILISSVPRYLILQIIVQRYKHWNAENEKSLSWAKQLKFYFLINTPFYISDFSAAQLINCQTRF